MRRSFISLGLATMMTLSVVGCGSSEPTVSPDTTTGSEGEQKVDPSTSTLDDKEAPMLADLVGKGELPPLEERLPVAADVMVEGDVVELGEYGGSLVTTCNDNGKWKYGKVTEQLMFRFKQDGSGELEPNVAKDFYSNDDATVWTIELREGMKWSDGEPFTAEDVVFYYDHMSVPALDENRVALDKEDEGYYAPFKSKAYNCYQVELDGVKYWAEAEAIDDHTVTFTFAAPQPSFPENVTIDNKWLFAPKHFYVDFISRKDGVTDDESFPYITEEEALANANEFFGKAWESYSTMGKDIAYYNWVFAEIPTVRAFIPVANNHDKVGETYTLVRNPYFFKTDSEGRQLPYLDSIDYVILNEKEQVDLKAAAGEFDMVNIESASFSSVATATKDTHKLVKNNPTEWSSVQITLNQTVEDLDKRSLFQDVRFREALSIAVDRDLLNATLMNNQAIPAQAAPPQGTPGYDEEWAKKWTEYDVDRANELLDEITEPWDKAPGTYRKMKGTDKDLSIIVSYATDKSVYAQQFTLLQSAYKEIGIQLLDKVVDDVEQVVLENGHEATLLGFAGATPALRPDTLVPIRSYHSWYGLYGRWYEDGKSTQNGGVEPPQEIKDLIAAYENIKSAVGENRNEIIQENVKTIYDVHKENIYTIGFLSTIQGKDIISNELMNIPNGLIHTDEYRGYLNLARPEQFYLAD